MWLILFGLIQRKRKGTIDLQNKKKLWQYLLKYLIFFAALFIVFIRFQDSVREIWQGVLQTPFQQLCLILLLGCIYFLIEGAIIHFMARKYVDTVSWLKGTACAYFCNFYRVLTFGSGSGFAEIYYLGQEGVDYARGTGMSLTQFIIQKAAMTFLGLLGLGLYYRQIRQLVGSYWNLLLLGFVLAFLIVAVLMLVGMSTKFSHCGFLLLYRICRNHPNWTVTVNKWQEQVSILQQETYALIHEKKKLLGIFFCNLAKWAIWCLVPCVSFQKSGLSVGFLMAIMAVSFTLSSVIPTPSGFGSLEVVFLLLYSPLVGTAQAGAAILLYRFVNIVLPFFIGSLEQLRLHFALKTSVK